MYGAPSCGPEVVDRRDVGVIEPARRLRLLLEAPQPVGVGGEQRRQHLDRDLALEPLVARAVHLSHASRADRREDLVGTELGAGAQRHFTPLDQVEVREAPEVAVGVGAVGREAKDLERVDSGRVGRNELAPRLLLSGRRIEQDDPRRDAAWSCPFGRRGARPEPSPRARPFASMPGTATGSPPLPSSEET